MDANLIRYIWRYTKRQQAWILAIVLLSMPTYFLSLELPKRIVNVPIQGRGFEEPGATQTFMQVVLELPSWLGGASYDLFSGIELERLGYLMALSAAFLSFVCINGLFKYYINTYKGRLGERMLRRIRFELVDRTMRFPLPQFRRVKASEVSTMVKEEVEPLGGFIGDAFVQPLFLGGQALTAMAFILLQNLWLGLLAVAGIVTQAVIIPRMRRRLIALAKQRQLSARELAGRVGEIVDGVGTIHLHDTSNFERAEISSRLGYIFSIRFEFYQRKFFIKFLNNFLSQLTPFLFYAIGGYFAIRGSLDIGQLVAVIAAYKDLPSPIKELIDWDQQRLDVQVKWAQVIEQFTVDRMLDPAIQQPVYDPVPALTGDLEVSNLVVVDESGAKLIEQASLRTPIRNIIGVIGPVNGGAETFAEVLARLVPVTSGRVMIAGQSLEDANEAVTGRRIGYAGPDTYLAQSSLYDALLYSLKHVPLRAVTYEGAARDAYDADLAETMASGNCELDGGADWIDYQAAGATGPDDIHEPVMRMLRLVNLHGDVYDLGLRGTIDPEQSPELAEKFLQGRHLFRERLAGSPLASYVEPFDPERYSQHATVAENVLFGTAVGAEFEDGNLAENTYLRSLLARTGLDEELFDMGREIASIAIELFADLTPDHPFFDQLSFMTPDEIPHYQAALARLSGKRYADAAPADQALFLRLPFGYIEPRHRLGLLDDALKARLLEMRRAFRDNLPERLASAIAFYDPQRYNAASTIQDNVLLGRVAYGVAEAPERIREAVHRVLDELGLKRVVREVGLRFNIGSGGKRLTTVQRQKLNLARALIKRPDLLIFNRALSALDPKSQSVILDRILRAARGELPFGVIWVLSNPTLADRFDTVVVFADGVLVEQGAPSDLKDKDGHFARLIA